MWPVSGSHSLSLGLLGIMTLLLHPPSLLVESVQDILGTGGGSVSGELVSPDLCSGVDGNLRDRTQGCRSPPRIPHGEYEVIGSLLGMPYKVQYKCKEGYALVGTAIVTCWISEWLVPQCKATCLKPRILHGKLSVEKDQYITPDNVTIQCDPGYRMVGSHIISCSEYRTWTPAVPTCKREDPGSHEAVLEGQDLLRCLSNPSNSKMALELYKLSEEVERLKQETDKGKST